GERRRLHEHLHECELCRKMLSLVAPDAPAPSPPPKEAPRFEVESELARGGLGVVHRGRDRILERTVAIKRLRQPSPDAERRFQREALMTAQLQHPAIVPVYDAGQLPSGEPFYAMKLVAGRPLDELIAEARTL